MDEILTFEEIRRYLKFSKSKLYSFVQQKKIPAYKIGRAWRFRRSRIDNWLKRQENVS